jgi:arylsulfatase A-like enzyme
MPKPNILYIFTDQMRASAMGCMHDEAVHTPHLDRLAAQGVLFTNAVANTPVCTPSRASLLTGRHAWTCRSIVNDIRLPEEERGIADVLRTYGYRTGYVGKWHLDGLPRDAPIAPERRHGFDDYWAAYDCTHDYLAPRYYLGDATDPVVLDEGYDADVQTGLAIDFLERYRDEPFCLYLSWGPPHAPYRAVPQPFLDMYPPDEIALRPNAQGADRSAIAGYYAHITAIDRDVGRLMDALDRLGLAEDTIVVFSSDHGDMLWSHGRVRKQQPWEESIRVPLIVRWPGHLPAGQGPPGRQVSDLLVSVVDYAPTLLGLAGIPIPTEMNGLDLSDTFLGRSDQRPVSALIAEYVSFGQSSLYQPWRGVRTPRYTYARWLQGGAVLYDTAEDPYQLRNLIHEPGCAPLRDELEEELQRWLTQIDDPFLDPDACFRHIGRWKEWVDRKAHFPRHARR